jgi:hypothetical protein
MKYTCVGFFGGYVGGVSTRDEGAGNPELGTGNWGLGIRELGTFWDFPAFLHLFMA